MIVATYFGLFMPALRPANTLGDDNRELQVRSRRRVDLERLRELYLPELGEVIQLRNTDYQFRAYCTREQWGQALARIAEDIDYMKFKDTPKSKLKDAKLSDAYLGIWNATLRVFPKGSVYDWRYKPPTRLSSSLGKRVRFADLTDAQLAEVMTDTDRILDGSTRSSDRLWDEREPDVFELAAIEDEHKAALWSMSESQRRAQRDHSLCTHDNTRASRKRCNRARREGK